MSATAIAGQAASAARKPQLGYELGRYNVLDGERVLYGTRSNSVAIVIDAPAGDDGRIYLVERDVDRDGYAALKSLIADYISVAQSTQRVPMARRAGRELAEQRS